MDYDFDMLRRMGVRLQLDCEGFWELPEGIETIVEENDE